MKEHSSKIPATGLIKTIKKFLTTPKDPMRLHAFEIFLLAMQCYFFGVLWFYTKDVCVIQSCTICYPHEGDLACIAGQASSSRYTVLMNASKQNFSLYLAPTHFENRDSWVASSCGDCYTCTEYLPNETVSCYFSSLDISRTLTTRSFKYYGLWFVFWLEMSTLLALCCCVAPAMNDDSVT